MEHYQKTNRQECQYSLYSYLTEKSSYTIINPAFGNSTSLRPWLQKGFRSYRSWQSHWKINVTWHKSKRRCIFDLKDRTQVVKLEDHGSTPYLITNEVPQGSVLEPIIINDLPVSVVDIYADDTTISTSADLESAPTALYKLNY